MDGTKILSMVVENLHFLDSLNYLRMSLKSRPNVATGINVNVAFAAYVTTQARLKLYEYLSEMEEPVL